MRHAALSLMFALIALFMLGCISTVHAESGEEFSPPMKDYTVWTPAEMEKNWGDDDDAADVKQAVRDGVERFMAINDGKVYALETIPLGTDTMEDIEREIPKKDEEYTWKKPIPVQGKNWEGRKFIGTKGEDHMLQLCAIDSGKSELVRLITTDTGPDGEKFFKSLEVNPENAKKRVQAHEDAATYRFTHPQTVLEVLGIAGLVFGLLGFAASTIWLIILGFRRHVLWGIGMIFIPIVRLVYVCMHWRESWVPFVIGVGSGILLIAGALNMPHL